MSAAAQSALLNHWNGNFPIDPIRIARAMHVEVVYGEEMGSALGRFESVNGQPRILVNHDTDELQRCYAVAHALGHHAQRRGARVVDVSREFPPVHFDISEHKANMFALALLIPDFAVETLIMRRNITNPWHMKDVFGVTLEAVELRLEKLGVVPCKYKHKREAPIRKIQAELRNYQAEVERYVRWATTLPRLDHI